MKTILEHIDGITLAGKVEWRCHECGARVETREMLHQHDERLLCDACNQRATPSN